MHHMLVHCRAAMDLYYSSMVASKSDMHKRMNIRIDHGSDELDASLGSLTNCD